MGEGGRGEWLHGRAPPHGTAGQMFFALGCILLGYHRRVLYGRTLAPPLPKPLPPLPRPDMLLVGGGSRVEMILCGRVLVQCSKPFRRMTPSLDPRAESFQRRYTESDRHNNTFS